MRDMASSLQHCALCARRCGMDRTTGAKGACGAGRFPRVARWLSHGGEEPPLSGSRGSGTIFFSGCSLRCVFCQNFALSQYGEGREISLERLAEIMIELQETGSHNINLVSPTHYAPQIAMALEAARHRGLHIPVVYNTHGYDTEEALAWMRGRVDIYLPDMKYADDSIANRLSGIKGYRGANRAVLDSMFSQVGLLEEDPQTGLASRGMMVRILLLPKQLEGAKDSLLYLKSRFSTELPISLMAQYAPVYKASLNPPLDRRLEVGEYEEAVRFALELGFDRLWGQDPASAHVGIPDFSLDTPFSF